MAHRKAFRQRPRDHGILAQDKIGSRKEEEEKTLTEGILVAVFWAR